MRGPLGRREPTDWRHVERYPLSALPTEEQPVNVPLALGVNWYSSFDDPVKGSDGRWWIGRDSLGYIRGGHCICAKSYNLTDVLGWWPFYDQGREGACVGFGWSRVMSLLNRKRYNAPWLYHEAQLIDEWPDTPPAEGTSVRAGGNILLDKGGITVRSTGEFGPYPREGVAAFRWATSWDEVRRTLGIPDFIGGVPLLNSWGTYYPHKVWLPDEVGERLLAESGEAAIPTDR